VRFLSSGSWAYVSWFPCGWNIGSYPKPVFPFGFNVMVPMVFPSNICSWFLSL